MELNLLPILNFDGRQIQISEDVDIKASEKDDFRIVTPVHFEGCAANVGSVIELKGLAHARLVKPCDRCMEEFETEISFEVDERFKKEDAFSDDDENPDIILFGGTAIDLDEVLYTSLYMNLPSKSLCREDCKGLCPICGCNLNSVQCDCSTESTDPRFDVLDKLL